MVASICETVGQDRLSPATRSWFRRSSTATTSTGFAMATRIGVAVVGVRHGSVAACDVGRDPSHQFGIDRRRRSRSTIVDAVLGGEASAQVIVAAEDQPFLEQDLAEHAARLACRVCERVLQIWASVDQPEIDQDLAEATADGRGGARRNSSPVSIGARRSRKLMSPKGQLDAAPCRSCRSMSCLAMDLCRARPVRSEIAER